MLKLANTVLILINPSPSNAKVPENTNDSSETERMTSHCIVPSLSFFSHLFWIAFLDDNECQAAGIKLRKEKQKGVHEPRK